MPLERSQSDTCIAVEIHVLSCGHGDTILLRLEETKWALVDCHLPDKPAKTQFFSRLEGLKISRLDILCLTHPHEDHYAGMGEVIDYFTTEGRSLGVFCDTGVNPKDIINGMRRLRKPKRVIDEYEAIHRRLDALFEARQVKYFRADRNSIAMDHFAVDKNNKRTVLIPVAPEPEVSRAAVRETLIEGALRGDPNELSLVLVLHVRGVPLQFHGILTGDTDGESLNAALDWCHRRAPHVFEERSFNFAKIPHHGSLGSHRKSRLAQCIKQELNATACISVGSSFAVLPDREVLKDYLDHQWIVLTTTKRVPRKQNPSLLDIFSTPTFEFEANDITVSWSELEGLRWSPAAARVATGSADLYETGSKKVVLGRIP